jgi:hypothetical protein
MQVRCGAAFLWYVFTVSHQPRSGLDGVTTFGVSSHRLKSSPAARKPDISRMYLHELMKLVSIHPGKMTSTDRA